MIMDKTIMQSIFKNKFVFLGAAAMVVVLAMAGKMVVDRKAEARIAEVLEDQELESRLTYKSVSAGWFGNSVTLRDVAIHVAQGEEAVLHISQLRLSDIRESEDSDIPSALRIQLKGLDMPIVTTDEGETLKLASNDFASLAGLGYTRLVGDVELRYDYQSEGHRLEVGMALDLEDMGKAHATVALEKVDLAALTKLRKVVAAPDLYPSALLLGLGLSALESAGNVRLAELDFRLNDAGLRERVLLGKREQAQFPGDLKNFAASVAEEVRKEGRREAKGSKGERVLAFYEELAEFVEDGGALAGKTDMERPVAIFSEGSMGPAFKGLQSFLTATRFELRH